MKPESAETTKRIKALADAMARKQSGKATTEDLNLIGETSVNRPGDISKARKAAGISGTRGTRSDVVIAVNGKNGNTVSWKKFYALKALASKMRGSVSIVFTPNGEPNAKPVSNEKIAELFATLDKVSDQPDGPTPSQVAGLVAK